MPEENAIIAEPVAPAVNQDEVVTEILIDDDGRPLGQNGEPQKEGNPNQAPSQGQPPAQAGQQQATQTPEAGNIDPNQPLKPDDLEASFFTKDEKGNAFFDVGKSLDFLNVDKRPPVYQERISQVQQPIVPPLNGDPAQPPVDPIQTYENDMRTELMNPFTLMKKYVDTEGMDVNTAYMTAMSDTQAYIKDRVINERLRLQEEGFNKRLSTEENGRELAGLKPVSDQNLYTMMNEYGKGLSPGQFKEAMFHKDYGGSIANALFDLCCEMSSHVKPEMAKLNGEPLRAELNNWFVRMMSNEKFMRILPEVTMATVQKKLFPAIIKQARGIKQGNELQNQNAAIGGQQGPQRQGQPAGVSKNQVDDWINEGIPEI